MKKIDIQEAAAYFKKSVVTVGNFDGYHRGHARIVATTRRLASEAGAVSVLLSFDPHPSQVVAPSKRPSLLTTQEEKEYFVQNSGIDYLCTLRFTPQIAKMSAGDFIRDILRTRLHACGLVVGENHQFGKNRTGDKEYLSRYKAEDDFFVKTVPLKTEGTVTISSSSMRELLAQGKVREMAEKMGHPYLIRVQRERGIGKASQMGYPTVNFRRPDPPKAVPPAGVYAAGLDAGDTKTAGALYIGDCPTFEGRHAHVEFYGLQADTTVPEIGDNEWVYIWVRDFVRGEQAFESEEELKTQIRKDVSQIVTFFKEEKKYVDYHGEETGFGSSDGDQ